MSTHAWYLNPETGDTKVFLTCESEIIHKAGYRLIVLEDLPLLALHAVGLLVKTPPALLALLRTGDISVDDLTYDCEADQMYLDMSETTPISQPLLARRERLDSYGALGKQLVSQ